MREKVPTPRSVLGAVRLRAAAPPLSRARSRAMGGVRETAIFRCDGDAISNRYHPGLSPSHPSRRLTIEIPREWGRTARRSARGSHRGIVRNVPPASRVPSAGHGARQPVKERPRRSPPTPQPTIGLTSLGSTRAVRATLATRRPWEHEWAHEVECILTNPRRARRLGPRSRSRR